MVVLSGCNDEYPEGIKISVIPRNFKSASILKISNKGNKTILKTEHSGEITEISITPYIRRISQYPMPDTITIDRIFRPGGVTTIVNLYKEDLLSIMIADNATLREKPLETISLKPGSIIAINTSNTSNNPDRIETRVLLSNNQSNFTQVEPGEKYRIIEDGIIWDFYYFIATIPNNSTDTGKNLSMDKGSFSIDWILIRNESP